MSRASGVASFALVGLLDVPPGIYRGEVSGIESGHCTARIEVRALPGGCRAFDYEAISDRYGLQHAEHAVAAEDALYVAFAEGRGVTIFARRGDDVYESDADPPMRIVASFTHNALIWAWHWGPAGEPPVERSRAVCRPAGY